MMFKYAGKIVAPKLVPKTLNDIPKGTVFTATVEGSTPDMKFSGVFLKLYEPGQHGPGTPVAVRLTLDRNDPPRSDVIYWVSCRAVSDYRELINPEIVERG